MITLRNALLTAAAAVCLVFAMATFAAAGTYSVTQAPCLANGWNYGGGAWAFAHSDSCAGSGNVTVNGPASSNGNIAFWRSPALPSTAYISGGSISTLLRYTTGAHGAHLRTCFNFAYTTGLQGSCGGDVRTVPDAQSNTWTTLAPHTGTSYNAIQVDVNGTEVGGAAAIGGINIQATENTAPTVSREVGGVFTWFPSGQWDHNTWIRGTKSMLTSAVDSNGLGVKAQNILIDGGTPNGGVTISRSSSDFGCSFGAWTPCPQAIGWTSQWDTTSPNGGVLDGPHTLRYTAVDAANNVGQTGLYGFNVDNTKPDTPADAEGQGDGLEGWSQTNSFDFSWTNGAETVQTTTQSGLSHVVIDLTPTQDGVTDPAPIVIPVGGSNGSASATVESITGLQLPEKTSYDFAIGLRDLAGNWSGNVTTDSNNDPTSVGPAIDGDEVTWSNTPPPAPDMQSNGWISEAELLSGYSQEWNVVIPQGGTKICGYAGSVTTESNSDPGDTINIQGPVNQWTLPADLAEGTHYVHVKSIGCNQVPSVAAGHTEANVDLTDPMSSYSGIVPNKWYKDGTTVTISATDALSGMQGAAPQFTYDRGAYLPYELNSVAPAEPPRGGQADISVTGEGEKQLRFAAVDLAGNRNDDQIVNFGIDASDPTGYLEHPDSATPTLLRAPLGDVVSGLETAVIEARRESGGDWTLLPTGLSDLTGAAVAGYPKSALASARFPDTKWPEDRYRIRVRTYDQAGNALITDRDKNGNPLIVDSGAMRAYSGLSATLFKAKRTCKKRKGVKCVKKARGKVVFLGGKNNLAVGYKRGAVVQGFLVDSSTKPLARQPVEIYTTAKGRQEILAGVTSTKADGSYVFKIRPGVSRNVRVYYPGTETRRDTSATVTLGTGAKLKLRVSKKRARTGQTVTFRGTVTSFDRVVPASGKIVALQFYAGKKWRPAVAIARTDSKGRFAVKYKFDGKRVKARIVFRVIAPAEDGWGHASSASRRVTMKLN